MGRRSETRCKAPDGQSRLGDMGCSPLRRGPIPGATPLSDGGLAALVRADADHFLKRDKEDLTVAYLARLSGLNDCIDGLSGHVVRDGYLNLDLGKKVHGVLASAVDLRVPLLPAESL